MSGIIYKRKWKLGLLEITTTNTETELYQAVSHLAQSGEPAKALEALISAAIVAGAREKEALLERIAKLEKKHEAEYKSLAAEVAKLQKKDASRNPLGLASEQEPDQIELQADYERRVRRLRALTQGGSVSWGDLVRMAYADIKKKAPWELAQNQRPPKPDELEVLEAWAASHANVE